MATNLLDRIPLERIEEQARPVNLGRLLMVLVVGVFYAIGWLASKTLLALGIGLGWAWAATKTGWQDARKPAAGRSRGVP